MDTAKILERRRIEAAELNTALRSKMYDIVEKKLTHFKRDLILDYEYIDLNNQKKPLLWLLRTTGTDIATLQEAAETGSWINLTIERNDTAYIIDNDLNLIPFDYNQLRELSKDAAALNRFIEGMGKK